MLWDSLPTACAVGYQYRRLLRRLIACRTLMAFRDLRNRVEICYTKWITQPVGEADGIPLAHSASCGLRVEKKELSPRTRAA